MSAAGDEQAERAGLPWRNRRTLAEREGLPQGALETCERLDGEHPGWMVWWIRANNGKGWERPAGYSASRADHSLAGGDELRQSPEDGVRRHLRVFAEDPEELPQRIAAMMERVEAEAAEEQRMRGRYLG